MPPSTYYLNIFLCRIILRKQEKSGKAKLVTVPLIHPFFYFLECRKSKKSSSRFCFSFPDFCRYRSNYKSFCVIFASRQKFVVSYNRPPRKTGLRKLGEKMDVLLLLFCCLILESGLNRRRRKRRRRKVRCLA